MTSRVASAPQGPTILAGALVAVLALGATAGGAAPTPIAPLHQSPSATAAPRVTSGVDYSAAGHASLLLDIYEPSGSSGAADPRPAIVLVHGGGWTTGDRTQVGPDAAAFAEQGFVAFSIDYGLEGPNRWPSQLDDVLTAVRWVQTNASTYGVDPTRIGLFGSSAGGNLVMLAATEGLGDGDAPPVRAVVSWSGPADLSTLAATNITADEVTDPTFGTIPGEDVPSGCAGDDVCLGVIDPGAIVAFVGCTVDECPQTYVDASPAFQASSSTPPMLLVSAQTDLVPVEQAYEMVNVLSGAGVASQILVVAGEGHAESYRSTALAPSTSFFTDHLVNGAETRTATGSPPSTVAGSQALPALVDGSRLPTPAPPPAVQAIVDPSPNLNPLIGSALTIVLLVGIGLVLWRRRTRSSTPTG